MTYLFHLIVRFGLTLGGEGHESSSAKFAAAAFPERRDRVYKSGDEQECGSAPGETGRLGVGV